MSRVLIISFEIVPEVDEYMAEQGADLETALRSLGMDMSDGVDTRLMAVEERDLHEYGVEDDDYVIVRNPDTLEFWGYDINESCEDLNIGIEDLRNLGVSIGVEEHRV